MLVAELVSEIPAHTKRLDLMASYLLALAGGTDRYDLSASPFKIACKTTGHCVFGML